MSGSPSCTEETMLVDFYYKLKEAQLPVSITEYLMLLEAMEAGMASSSVGAGTIPRNGIRPSLPTISVPRKRRESFPRRGNISVQGNRG